MIQFLCRANYQDQPSRPSCWFAFLGPLTSTTSAVIFWVDLFAFIRNMFEHILLIPVPSTSHRSKLSSRNKNLLVRNSCITFIQSIFHLTLDRRWLTTCWLLTSLMKCESLGHCKTTLKVLIKCWYLSCSGWLRPHRRGAEEDIPGVSGGLSAGVWSGHHSPSETEEECWQSDNSPGTVATGLTNRWSILTFLNLLSLVMNALISPVASWTVMKTSDWVLLPAHVHDWEEITFDCFLLLLLIFRSLSRRSANDSNWSSTGISTSCPRRGGSTSSSQTEGRRTFTMGPRTTRWDWRDEIQKLETIQTIITTVSRGCYKY